MTDKSAEEYEIDEPWVKFFSAIGYAITRWSEVDVALFECCRFALNASREKTAVVFYRSLQIGDHLVLTNKLLELSLSEAKRKQWARITSQIEEHLPFRNHLAHDRPISVIHVNIQLGKPKARQDNAAQFWWQIETEKTKLLNRKGKPMTSKLGEIVNHIRAVEDLLSEMDAFRKALPKRPTAPQKARREPPRRQASAPKKK